MIFLFYKSISRFCYTFLGTFLEIETVDLIAFFPSVTINSFKISNMIGDQCQKIKYSIVLIVWLFLLTLGITLSHSITYYIYPYFATPKTKIQCIILSNIVVATKLGSVEQGVAPAKLISIK